MRRLVGSLLLIASVAGAASAGDEDYRVVIAEGGESLDRRLNAAAGDGYRMLATTIGVAPTGEARFVVLMERADDGEYGYRAFEMHGDLSRSGALDEVNALAAEGFDLRPEWVLSLVGDDLWLPESQDRKDVVVIMERPPSFSPGRYDTIGFSEPDPFHEALAESWSSGAEILGMWNAYRRPRVLIELRAEEFARSSDDELPFRLFVKARRRDLRKSLSSASHRQYRVVDAIDQTILAPPIVLIRRVESAEPLKFKMMRYPLRKIRKDKLEKKMKKRGKKGFRVTAQGITDTQVILQRTPDKLPKWDYRALSSKQSPGLPRAMERAVAAGFELIAMFHNSDETTVLLGRPVPE